jgi:NAD+ synthase
MSLQLQQPDRVLAHCQEFIRQTFIQAGKTQAVVAVSGGIDSALSLTLTVKALGADQVTPLFLPYDNQSTADSQLICEFNQIPQANWRTVNIQPVVKQFIQALPGVDQDQVRLGNIMARSRMIVVYDFAKAQNALVVGTENKSEHYLGYFTRFGDAASDLEPITHFYKTQVRQLVHYLNLPDILVTKAPSAGLWPDQTDETHMGFTYQQADLVLEQLIDEGKLPQDINVEGISTETINNVTSWVTAMAFKRQVPYVPSAATAK